MAALRALVFGGPAGGGAIDSGDSGDSDDDYNDGGDGGFFDVDARYDAQVAADPLSGPGARVARNATRQRAPGGAQSRARLWGHARLGRLGRRNDDRARRRSERSRIRRTPHANARRSARLRARTDGRAARARVRAAPSTQRGHAGRRRRTRHAAVAAARADDARRLLAGGAHAWRVAAPEALGAPPYHKDCSRKTAARCVPAGLRAIASGWRTRRRGASPTWRSLRRNSWIRTRASTAWSCATPTTATTCPACDRCASSARTRFECRSRSVSATARSSASWLVATPSASSSFRASAR